MKKFGGIGEDNYRWKGGRYITFAGYVHVNVGRHHLADKHGYAAEHRMVAEAKLGRRLLDGEVVHHKDGDKQNNDPDNLEILPSVAHHSHEHGLRTDRRHPDEENVKIVCACGCGTELFKYDYLGRPRERIAGHMESWIADDDIAQMRLDALAGMSWSKLESKYNVPKGRIRRICAEQHSDRRNLITPTKARELRSAIESGTSFSEITAKYGVSRSALYRFAKKMKIR